MTTPHLLRLALLGALGLATGCEPTTAIIGRTGETDEPGPCGEHPRLTPELAQSLELGTYEVCAPASPGEACPDAADLQAWTFLSEALGPHPEPDFCGWYGEEVCGPTPSDADECCYVMVVSTICEGRALLPGSDAPDGAARTAAPAARGDWSDGPALADLHDLPDQARAVGAALWTRTALAEHASVASFARATLELMSLGAPAALVAETAEAQADEVRHAAQAFAIATALAGRPIGPGPLRLDGVGPRSTPDAILVGLVVEGCVNETLAAAEATEAARRCTTPALARALAAVASDETRHASLAWKTLRWLVDAHPELRPLALRTLTEALEFRGPIDPTGLDDPDAHRVGALSSTTRRELAADVVRDVVRPLAFDLLDAPESECRAT